MTTGRINQVVNGAEEAADRPTPPKQRQPGLPTLTLLENLYGTPTPSPPWPAAHRSLSLKQGTEEPSHRLAAVI